MWPNRQFPADLVTFTKEILNGNFIFCAVLLVLGRKKIVTEKDVSYKKLNEFFSSFQCFIVKLYNCDPVHTHCTQNEVFH